MLYTILKSRVYRIMSYLWVTGWVPARLKKHGGDARSWKNWKPGCDLGVNPATLPDSIIRDNFELNDKIITSTLISYIVLNFNILYILCYRYDTVEQVMYTLVSYSIVKCGLVSGSQAWGFRLSHSRNAVKASQRVDGRTRTSQDLNFPSPDRS